jgi:O-antigen/teichoic acid export membrane protein
MWTDKDKPSKLLARNVAMDYVAIAIDLALGMVMLPFNVSHLGPSAYGLFVLSTSVTTYFSMLDMGYGSAQVKFAAQYRAFRDVRAINEIASTLFFLFIGIAAISYLLAAVVAANIGSVLRLAPEDVSTATAVVLMVSVYAALGLPFSVFGGVTNGFQRFYLNNYISIATSLSVAAATYVVLSSGYGIVELVAATTTLRILSLFAYRRSAYRAFPLLSIRWRHVRVTRLREVTGFSVFLLMIEIAGKINFTSDTVVIGAFMGTAAVAVWAVGARLIAGVRSLSTVMSRFLFPMIVDSAVLGHTARLRTVLVQGTRLSLAVVIPLAFTLALLADVLILEWVGPGFEESATVVWVLASVLIVRIGNATAYSVLKGADGHRFAAACSVGGALANLALSIILVQYFGLPGVAFGTLIPVVVVAALFVYPAACRRADLSLWRAFRIAMWPAIWPAIPMAAGVLGMRHVLPPGWPMIVAASAVGGAIYATAFALFALRHDERRWYVRKVSEVVRWPSWVTAGAR